MEDQQSESETNQQPQAEESGEKRWTRKESQEGSRERGGGDGGKENYGVSELMKS